MSGSQGGKHAIRNYLAQILISIMKALREDNEWDEFEIESDLEDKVDTKYISYEPLKISKEMEEANIIINLTPLRKSVV